MIWTNKLKPVFRRLSPVAKVVQSATSVLGQLQNPTPIGIVNAVASAVRTIDEVTNTPEANWGTNAETYLEQDTILAALQRIGGVVVERHQGSSSSTYEIACGDLLFRIYADGSAAFDSSGYRHPYESPSFACLAAAVDTAAPPISRLVRMNPDAPFDLVVREEEINVIGSDFADRVWARTAGMLDGGRAILLEGRPGIGKTTAANAIAVKSGLGRILRIDHSLYTGSRAGAPPSTLNPLGLRALNLGVVIIDDVDKISVPLETLELVRQFSKLVILTANNGNLDSVLDGAMMRPARVDEVFEIVAELRAPPPPFDMLTSEQWDEIGLWPIAYLNELAKRIRSCPDDLRIDDLRGRLKRRTRSGDVIA